MIIFMLVLLYLSWGPQIYGKLTFLCGAHGQLVITQESMSSESVKSQVSPGNIKLRNSIQCDS